MMLKRTFTMSLALLLVNFCLAPVAFGAATSEKEQKFIEKLKANIKSQGIGENSKIKLKLKDGTKLNSYISEIGDNGIVVVNEKNGQGVPVPYPQVKQAKGNNWSQNTTFAIILVAIIVIPIILLATAKD